MEINELKDNINEDFELFCILNNLDMETEKELNFIVNSFVKYYSNTKIKKSSLSDKEILESFEISLYSITLDLMGTSFKTKAIELYKEIPTIKKLISESFLNPTRQDLVDELTKTRNKYIEIEKQLNLLKKGYSSGSSSSSSGGCSGGRSSSYGRC